MEYESADYTTLFTCNAQSKNSILMTSYMFKNASIELWWSANPFNVQSPMQMNLPLYYNKNYSYPIKKQHFDDVIEILKCSSSISWVQKPPIPLNNQYNMNLSRYYNQYSSHPIRKQYVDDVIQISKYFH